MDGNCICLPQFEKMGEELKELNIGRSSDFVYLVWGFFCCCCCLFYVSVCVCVCVCVCPEDIIRNDIHFL